jgi:hypothetical protein
LIAAKIQRDRATANMDPAELLSIDRTDLSADFDPQWFETSSPDRIAEIAHWRRESLFPKTHLDIPHVQVHGSFCSIKPATMDRTEGSGSSANLFKIARTADGFITATGAERASTADRLDREKHGKPRRPHSPLLQLLLETRETHNPLAGDKRRTTNRFGSAIGDSNACRPRMVSQSARY